MVCKASAFLNNLFSDPVRCFRHIIVTAILTKHTLHAHIPCLNSFHKSVVVAKMNIQLTRFDSCSVLGPCRVIAHPGYTRGVILLWRLIALILLVGTYPKVAPPIVQCVQTDMIHLISFRDIWNQHSVKVVSIAVKNI